MKSLLHFKPDQEHIELFIHGFEKKELLTRFVTSCHLSLLNAASLLWQQIRRTPNSKIYFGSALGGTRSHASNAEVGVAACQAVEKHNKSFTRLGFVWKTTKEDNVQSVIGCVQVFSDKYQTSLKAGGLAFYPLYVTLINFSGKMGHLQILSKAAVLAYLLVTFESRLTKEKCSRPASRRRERAAALESLHEFIELCLRPIFVHAYRRLHCKTRSSFETLVHSLHASFVADMPETEGLHAMNLGRLTKFPCHKCLVIKDTLPQCKLFPKQRLDRTYAVMYSFSEDIFSEKKNRQCFVEKSM